MAIEFAIAIDADDFSNVAIGNKANIGHIVYPKIAIAGNHQVIADGKFFFMHRIKPDIQWVAVDKLEDLTSDFWMKYYSDFTRYIFFKHQYSHESSYIGAGCPPIELEEGWLMIYHSVCDTPEGYVYSASAALLDKNNPTIELARLPYPLFTPETSYEVKGVVNRVCFPTGAIVWEDRLYIYYGAGDRCIACASVVLQELVDELLAYKK